LPTPKRGRPRRRIPSAGRRYVHARARALGQHHSRHSERRCPWTQKTVDLIAPFGGRPAARTPCAKRTPNLPAEDCERPVGKCAERLRRILEAVGRAAGDEKCPFCQHLTPTAEAAS
jgi:hypothetical protein